MVLCGLTGLTTGHNYLAINLVNDKYFNSNLIIYLFILIIC